MQHPPTEYGVDAGYRQRLNADANLFHVIFMLQRPGAMMFARTLELRHFPPGSRDNDNYHLIRVLWEQLPYFVISVPLRYRRAVEDVADECGMRLADGVPHVISQQGAIRFPIDAPTAFTLENKSASIVYAGQAGREQADGLQLKKIQEEDRKHYAWFDSQQEVWVHGRLWKRLPADVSNELLARIADTMEFGTDRGNPSTWYTETPRDPEWRPYPK